MSSSSLSARFCFNHECLSSNSTIAVLVGVSVLAISSTLCDRCASAYEQGKFVTYFTKGLLERIHCGCIASASAYTLMDAGGIECLACARKKFALGPNFSPSPSFLFQSPISEKFKDLSINWSSSTRSNQISYQPPSCLDPSVLQFDFRNRGGNNEFSQPASKERVTACTMEKKRGMNDMIGKLMSENSKHYRVSPFPNVNVYHPLISLKEGPCGTQLAFPVPITTPIEKTGHSRLDGSNLWHTRNFSAKSLTQ
ncbi:hypothetical protein ISN45_Aa02g002950 [Arabidopsis thaliana x Arabidopsis arenosa]|uniref:VAL1-3 N-terminal zinc finger domain-containing protein n=1 Tax=Arabidopsis thaliana x Arabidopsis arenosa TaxID=1240361 RepID=A0A8T2BMG2_9BRAS|nr:hypothetical protein ISN45_Aa02g002950 [Arabidopsis thaliana x Arabidopsis arenosa]